MTTGNSVVGKALAGSLIAGAVMIGWVYLVSRLVGLGLGDAARFVGGYVDGSGDGSLRLGRVILFAMAPVWGLVYGYVRPLLPGSETQRGLLFGALVWLLSTVLLFPLLALFHPAPGIAEEPGLGGMGFGGFQALLVSLTAHLLFGWILGWWVGNRLEAAS